MTPQESFLRSFVQAPAPQRPSVVEHVKTANWNDSRILNLVANVNYNDVSPKNRNQQDNIYWIVKQLGAFREFQF